MRLVLAVSILAQTIRIPVCADSVKYEVKRGGSRKKRIQDLALQLSGSSNEQSNDGQFKGVVSAIAPIFLKKTLSDSGILKNSYISKKVVECDPNTNADEADIGILSCGMNQYCIESETSTLGGVCVDPSAGLHTMENRDLQQVGVGASVLGKSKCDPQSPNYGIYDCDCSAFHLTKQEGTGTITCTIYDYFCPLVNVCGAYSVSTTYSSDGTIRSEYCYDLVTPQELRVCYSSSIDIDTPTPDCHISVNNVNCTSCDLVGLVHPVYGFTVSNCYEFNCTNTLAGISGNDCLSDRIIDAVFYDTLAAETRQPSSSVPPDTRKPSSMITTSPDDAPGPTLSPSPPPAQTSAELNTEESSAMPRTTRSSEVLSLCAASVFILGYFIG